MHSHYAALSRAFGVGPPRAPRNIQDLEQSRIFFIYLAYRARGYQLPLNFDTYVHAASVTGSCFDTFTPRFILRLARYVLQDDDT